MITSEFFETITNEHDMEVHWAATGSGYVEMPNGLEVRFANHDGPCLDSKGSHKTQIDIRKKNSQKFVKEIFASPDDALAKIKEENIRLDAQQAAMVADANDDYRSRMMPFVEMDETMFIKQLTKLMNIQMFGLRKQWMPNKSKLQMLIKVAKKRGLNTKIIRKEAIEMGPSLNSNKTIEQIKRQFKDLYA